MASRRILIPFAAALVAAALLWAWRGADGPAAPVGAAAAPGPRADGAPPAPGAPAATAAARAGAAGPGATSLAGPPPGLDAAQWAAVEAKLARGPDPAGERARLWHYFAWSDAVARWRQQPTDAALARAVDEGLPERLARAEVSVPEARVLKLALLQTLEPDEAGRRAALAAFDATLPRSAGPGPAEREFQQRQAALVAAWRAQPAAQRDPAALARDIDALRLSLFQKSPKETPR